VNTSIHNALLKLFDRHRIVFWYDTKQELRAEYEALDISDIQKVELTNNEFGIKYKVLRESPEQKYLLYRHGPQPVDLDNWLLDVQLAHGEFRTDQAAIWLSELGLGYEYTQIVDNHPVFFEAGKRKETLKKLLAPDDTVGQLRLKMLAVCAGADSRLDSVIEYLFQELADQREEKIKLIERCNLTTFLWEQLSRVYGYRSNEPSVHDFAVELFKSCYALGTDGMVSLTSDALVLLKRWKDSRQFASSFETLSGECAKVLAIEQNLASKDYRDVVAIDYFRLIDQKIISDLVKAVATRTVSLNDVSAAVSERRNGHWFGEFEHIYESIEIAAQFVNVENETAIAMDSLANGIQRYCQSWFRVDQLYRKFVYHVRMSSQPSLLGDLSELIENLYSNNFLLRLGDRFSEVVEASARWDAAPILSQNQFYDQFVQPFLRKDNKVCVIISDAMRYEIGEELLGLIRQEDRYTATLEPILSMLPSYTQLGMAALLPNKTISIADNDTGTVIVDGQNSQGTVNRTKILQASLNGRATACKATDLLEMKGEDCRALIRDHDVLYIYHNHIDFTGDKRESEDRVFEAVEDTLQDLIKLIRKLASGNANNLLVTADHGFVYQSRDIDESDFSASEASGDVILYRDRRFVLGKGLEANSSLHSFTSAEVGLSGDVEIQIPKSINRLRLRGSGSKYVHGGATLQEVVVPVLRINKKRQSDITLVDIDIFRGSTNVISSGQLAVTMYQQEAVTDKVQARILKAGIYTLAGDLVSDTQELTFDIRSENPRDREKNVRFVISKAADSINGQEVVLRLDEKHSGTTHYKEYKSIRYMMRRSFTSDFDL
jgi:uncharacterized protein (TIGR02687 family)